MPPKCRAKDCQQAVDPGYDLCFAHRLEQDAAREAAQLEEAEQLEQDFRETFGSEEGLRVLVHLASAFYLGESTVIINSKSGEIDSNLVLVNEGSRLVILRILALSGRLNLTDMEDLWRKKKEKPRAKPVRKK